MPDTAPATSVRLEAYGSWALRIALGIALWLAWIDRPEPPVGGLDDSWQAALGYAHVHDLQFGREVLFTHGPWGWLSSHFLPEAAQTGKRLWETIGKLLLVGTAVWLTGRLSWPRRIVFFVLLASCGLFFPDTHYAALMAVFVLFGLMEARTPLAGKAWLLAILGWLATMKFTYAVLGMSGVGLVVAHQVWRREWKTAALVASTAVASFLVAWLLAGQSLVHLLDHVRMSLELSGGYPSAMSIDEPLPIFFLGASATLLVVGGCVFAWRCRPETRAHWPAVVYLLFVTYVMWKHGFSRADGHVYALFSHAILLGVFAAPAIGWRGRFDPFLPAMLVGVSGFWIWNPAGARAIPHYLQHHLRNGFAYVASAAEARARFAATLEQRRSALPSPSLRSRVGDATIDALGHNQAILLLEDLNYHPRPVIQSYSVYTPTLMRRNLRFIQSDRAPEFLLWQNETIDARFPSLDDALVLAELPRRYEKVEETHAGLLLRRRAQQPAHRDQEFREVLARHVGWGETVALPPAPRSALWIECLFDRSFVGRLRSLLYKPGSIQMVVTDDTGREARHRILPAVAEAGFLAHPFLETDEDAGLLFDSAARRTIQSVRFEPARADERELWSGIHVRVYELPELPLEPLAPFDHYVRLGIASHAPLEVQSTIGVHRLTDVSPAGILVHAPGHMLFAVAPESRRLTGGFGLREPSYQGDGHTDGVVFSVQAEDGTGARTEIWSRTLRPLSEVADRGTQRFDIAIPEGTVRVRLVTTPGETDNTDWDWSYWNGVTFAP
ncbi:hypothetical protein ASA1KI_45580 [Opitutales bacterium ASA1]|uniref:hypothetical protein n=1 Tax=Congregicoccus parvus TaxID=3081749 RepID=UPI002B2EACF2|nr:hypothetical protein ASA1KI_45580 [Opitutales bacterium ASA1]